MRARLYSRLQLFQANFHTPILHFGCALAHRHKRIAATATDYRRMRSVDPLGFKQIHYTHRASPRKRIIQRIAADLIGMADYNEFGSRHLP